MFNLLSNWHALFSKKAALFYVLTNSVWWFHFSTSLPTFVTVFFIWTSFGCEVVFPYGFDLHIFMAVDVEDVFVCMLVICRSLAECLFSPILWVVFLFSWYYPLEHKLFKILMKSNICILSFVPCNFSVISKKSLPNPRLQRFMHVLCSRSFIIVAFTKIHTHTPTLRMPPQAL